jgi:hypothetical protein
MLKVVLGLSLFLSGCSGPALVGLMEGSVNGLHRYNQQQTQYHLHNPPPTMQRQLRCTTTDMGGGISRTNCL